MPPPRSSLVRAASARHLRGIEAKYSNSTQPDSSGYAGLGSALRHGWLNRVEHLAMTTEQPRNGALPAGGLGASLAETGWLPRAGVGVETVTLDYGSWDMHVNLGDVGAGAMTTMATELAQGARLFFVCLGP